MSNLEELQLELEQESLGLGIKRYREALASRGEHNLPAGIKLIKQAIEPLTKAITRVVDEVVEGKASKTTYVVKFLSQFDADAVAYMTAKTCIEFLHRNKSIQQVALALASRLEGMLNYDELKRQDPRAYKRLMKVLKSHTGLGPEHRHVVIRKQQKWAGIVRIKWDKGSKLRLGTVLVQLMCETTGLVELRTRKIAKNKTPTILVSTEATRKWLEEAHNRCELLSPFDMPMVCQPTQWDGPYGGGYLTKELQYPLIKTANKGYLNELTEVDMPVVYNAINALQATKWKVNKAVFNVLNQVWAGGGVLGKIPSIHDEPMPAMNYDPKDPANADKHTAWKKKAAKVHEANFRSRSKRLQLVGKLWVAEKFEEYDGFYFPHALDWRGRAYPVSAGLNPQGDDVSKALLTFHEGKELGENGAYWLAMHGANCYGVDKVDFDSRIKWVQENSREILECAFKPLDTKFWQEADKPYQFLAFCFEWVGYTMTNGDERYVSHLPIQFDGTCNGLQNFSAMLRDEVGGRAVGLVPTDTPPDVYKDVLVEAERLIAAEAKYGKEIAVKWEGNMTRDLTKQNTMTTPYGVSEFGMKEQLMNAFTKMRDAGHDFGFDTGLEDATYLAEINYMAISNTVIAARKAMNWLKESAIVAASNNLPVSWTTPSGLPVLQSYRTVFGKRYDFDVEGKRFRITLKIEGDKLDRRRQSTGIAPNFVHSLDASHLMLTINYCLDAGITTFSMVHDSYGTHAANADTLSLKLREAFYDQYSDDVLAKFRDQLLSTLPPKLVEKIKPLPEMGKLDLAAVLNSEYFFA